MWKHLYLFKYGVKWAMKNGSRVVQNAAVFLLFYIKKKRKRLAYPPATSAGNKTDQPALFGNSKFTLYLRKQFSRHMLQEETAGDGHKLLH